MGSQHDRGYEEFLQSLALIGLGLKDCSAHLNRELLFSRKSVKRTLNSDYRLKVAAPEYFESEGSYKLTMSPSGNSGKLALAIKFTFEVHMHAERPINKKFAQKFTDSQLKLILLPYARSFISDITAKMGIPPVLIQLASS